MSNHQARSSRDSVTSTLKNRTLGIVSLILFLTVGWNYWLPIAEDFFNQQTKPPNPPNVDFLAYYNAGVRFERGDNPYYWVMPDPEGIILSDYLYPPTMLPFFNLFSNLEYEQARHLWLFLYAFSYITAFVVLLFMVRRQFRLTFLVLGLLLTIASYPLLLHIRNGQSDVLVISLVLVGFAAYARNCKVGSAILFALATLVKVSPVLFLIYFVIFLKDYRFLVIFCLISGVIVLFSFLVVPINLYPDYLLNVLPQISSGTSYWLNQSVLKIITSNESLARLISIIGFGLFALFAWYISRKFNAIDRAPRIPLAEGEFVSEGLFLMNLLVVLFFAGKAWSMAYVWTILPSALLLTYLLHTRTKTWYLVIVSIAIFLLTSKVYGFPVLDSLNLLGNFILTSCLAILLLKRERVMERIGDLI